MEYTMILQILLLTFTISNGAADKISKCEEELMPVTKIINSLGFRLEQMIEHQNNYFFSPLSISVALAMVYIGTRGTTREHMSEALEYNIVGKNCLPNKISENFEELIRELQNEGDSYSLMIANGAFIQTNLQISHYYSSSLDRYFNSKVKYLNFDKEEMVALAEINEWVDNKTKGKIPQLLAEPPNPMTLMVLVNAIYFKGKWDLPFNESLSRNATFYGINNSEKEARFMLKQEKVNNYYDAEKNYLIIEQDYMGGNVSMLLVLPRDRKEFPRYEITNKLLCKLRGKFQYSMVTIMIPKFNIEFQRELSKDMTRMGMGELFSEKGDLTAIREQNDLHVSLMVHKAVIEVNEQGSEASAALTVIIDGRNRIPSEEIFMANHPFLFYIIHKETNTVLFSGRVVDP